MRTFVAAFVVAAILGAALTPIVRRLALRVGAVSQPGGRHIHSHAIPRLGGVAVALSFFAPLLALFLVESTVAEAFRADTKRVVGLFVGGAVMCAVGVVDDTRGLRALHKLFAQLVVAALAFACGYQIEAVNLPFVGEVSMGVLALPITLIWMIGIINAVNLIDGLDGLAAGVVFFACLTNLVVSHIAGASVVTLLMSVTMGSVVGFLFYNFNPARIFMGDSGSYFLGFVLAATSLAGGPKASTPVALLVPIIALGVPIFDVLLAMVRRVLERRSIFSPDRGHIHHRLLDMGITHRRAVLIIYGVSLVFTGTAIIVYVGRSWQVGLALAGASVVLFMLVRMAGYYEYFRARKTRSGFPRTEEVQRLRRHVPRLTMTLRERSSTDEMLQALDEFCAAVELRSCVLADRSSGEVLHRWGAESQRGEEVTASFQIGRGSEREVECQFTWASGYGEVSPQAEILLQVAVDQLEAQLLRVCSRLFAPEASRVSTPGKLGAARAADLA